MRKEAEKQKPKQIASSCLPTTKSIRAGIWQSTVNSTFHQIAPLRYGRLYHIAPPFPNRNHPRRTEYIDSLANVSRYRIFIVPGAANYYLQMSPR